MNRVKETSILEYGNVLRSLDIWVIVTKVGRWTCSLEPRPDRQEDSQWMYFILDYQSFFLTWAQHMHHALNLYQGMFFTRSDDRHSLSGIAEWGLGGCVWELEDFSFAKMLNWNCFHTSLWCCDCKAMYKSVAAIIPHSFWNFMVMTEINVIDVPCLHPGYCLTKRVSQVTLMRCA